jgi:hypothetical protein
MTTYITTTSEIHFRAADGGRDVIQSEIDAMEAKGWEYTPGVVQYRTGYDCCVILFFRKPTGHVVAPALPSWVKPRAKFTVPGFNGTVMTVDPETHVARVEVVRWGNEPSFPETAIYTPEQWASAILDEAAP